MVPTSHMPEVRELDACLAATGKQDKEAFARLYTLAAPAVYSYALSILKSAPDAEDVLQDCFLHLYRAAPAYRSQGKPMAWILTTARNLSMECLRSRAKSADCPPDEASLVEDDRLLPEDRLVLRQCLTGLSDEERQIVVLHAVAGLKHREIAAHLGLPLSTVLSKYNRALKKLKTVLEKESVSL